HAVAMRPARMPAARWSLAGFLDVTPVAPPWLWTSTETLSWRSFSAAADGALEAATAGVFPRGRAQPATIAPAEASSVLHIQCRRVNARRQQSMATSSVMASSYTGRSRSRCQYSVGHGGRLRTSRLG